MVKINNLNERGVKMYVFVLVLWALIIVVSLTGMLKPHFFKSGTDQPLNRKQFIVFFLAGSAVMFVLLMLSLPSVQNPAPVEPASAPVATLQQQVQALDAQIQSVDYKNGQLTIALPLSESVLSNADYLQYASRHAKDVLIKLRAVPEPLHTVLFVFDATVTDEYNQQHPHVKIFSLSYDFDNVQKINTQNASYQDFLKFAQLDALHGSVSLLLKDWCREVSCT